MTPPPAVLLDTDMGNDIDDALALAMLHELQRLEECRLIGITISKGNPWAAAYTRLVNARCGNPAIPIGEGKDAPTPEDGNFIRLLAEPQGNPLVAEDAVALLRRLLAAQPDQSVILVTIGFFTNVSRLIDSPSDEISDLDGRALVARKVRFVSCMAGNFRPEISTGPDVGNPEFNIRTDIPAAQNFVEKCPCPIFFSGFEIGAAVLFPAVEMEKILAVEPHHPVAAGYAAYLPMPYDRQSWDQTAVLQAIRPDAGYFELSKPGYVRIDAEGYTEFAFDQDGPHRYLSLPTEGIPRVREAIIALSIQFPPVGAPSSAAVFA